MIPNWYSTVLFYDNVVLLIIILAHNLFSCNNLLLLLKPVCAVRFDIVHIFLCIVVYPIININNNNNAFI